MAVLTNPHMSAVHAANFSRAIGRARNEAELAAAAQKHSPFLLADDAKRMREEYAARLGQMRGLKP